MADDQEKISQPVKLQFHYIKGPEYREMACHGAIGGPTPQGKIWMALFSERTPIPRMVEYELRNVPEGATTLQFNEQTAGPPNLIDSRQGVIRHVEFTTYLDVEIAERTHKWLGDQLDQIKKLQGGS